MKRLFFLILGVLSMVGLSAQQVVTTEGTEYWLTFLNNAKWDPQDDLNDGKKFELELVVTARQATQVRVELRGTVIATLNVPAGGGTAEQTLVNWQKQIYLLESQNANLYQGLRVYTEDKNTPFTCYTYTRTGDPGISLRDIAMVYPVDLLDKEYFIQTYPDDDYSTQLAFVVTEDNTDVQVFPTYPTLQQTPLAWTNLRKGTAVLVASAPHQGTNSSVGLSGTRVCASKPIAVFNGNQATKSPYDGAYSSGYMVEQTLPIVQWGTKFYLALLGNTKMNSYIITAAYDDTEFRMLGYDEDLGQVVTQTVTLNRGESIDPNILDEMVEQDVIITSKPALCYVYTTAAAANYFRPNNMGNSCSAMLPAWEHRIKSMPFVTKKLDPLTLNSEKHFVYVVTPTADTDKLTLDGQPVAASSFTPFTSDPAMSFASLRVSVDAGHGHLLETTGEGFVGMVYDIAAAQANFYTLGFHYLPYQDSLFVTNTEDVMSQDSYNLARMNQGWYQRQNDEFPADQNRLDTAVICENTTLNWLVQTYIQGNTSPVVWELYDVSDDSGVARLVDTYRDESPATTTMHRWQHLFVLPEEKELEPGNRDPYRLFRLDAILHKAHTICTNLEDDVDTLQMVVRVNRVYDDTVHRVICLGDEYRFFYDNMDCQGNLSHQVPQPEITSFVGDTTAGDSAIPFSWKARLGQNLFTRRYQTINGCDSISTLDLFVCDTFRIIDTIHICDNQRITWQKKTYAGTKYNGRSTHVVKDSAVFEAAYKTQWCPCVENNQYPAFVGCDSTYELHLYVHPTYQDTIEAEMCINGDSAQAYLWDIHEGADQLAITIKDPAMKQADGYWEGYFYDSLKTKTCPDCPNGLGCDSVRVLHLVIPDSYYYEEKVDFCGAHYDYDLLSMVSDAYVWAGHPTGAHLTQSGDYYDSCRTVAGCDSIYHLALSVHSPSLDVDRYAMPNNQTYTWHGQTYGPFPDHWNDTTLYFYDQQATSTSFGCDSIVRLDLKIAQTFLITEEREICDGDSVLWRGKKIVSAGYDYTSQGFTPDVVCSTSSVVVYDSLLTVTSPQRDSVYQLNLTIHPVYAFYDTLYICDNASDVWQGRLYQGANASADGSTAYWTKPQGEYDDVCAWQSEYGCDSIYYLHLIVKPTYAFAAEDSAVCQNTPFEWNEHNGHTLYCVEEGQYVSSISTSSAGVFTYLDSLKTYSCADCGVGCDSVYTLRLQVYPTYYFRETLTICEGDSVEWQGYYRLGKEAVRTESTDYFGDRMYVTTDYTVPYQTHSGCDSIYYLHLIVNPRKHTHIDYAMCDYENYDFNGKPYHRPSAGIYLDTVHLQTAHSCDSVVTLRLIVHPSYTYTLQDTICASEAPYQITYGMETYSFWQTTDTILLTPSSAACDSALHLQLQVNPTYYFRETLTICEGDSVEWQGHYRLGKEAVRTESTDYFGDRMYVTTDYTASYQTKAGCDSIYNLHLIVNPRKHTHIDYAMCDYEDYDFNGKPYHRPAAGIYLDTVHLQTAYSCDSVVTLRLIVHPSYTYTLQDTICASEAPYQITYGTKTYSFSQTIDTILLTPSSAACDSALHLQLQVNPTYYFHETLTICEGDSVEWQGQYRYGQDTVRTESTDYFGDRMYVTTDYTASYQTKAGCDSIYYLHLIVNPRKHTHIDYAMCDYENYDFNGKPYHRPSAGIYLDTVHLQTAHSCDSVVTLRLVVHPSYTYTLQDTICASEAPYQITYGTETYSFSQTTDTILLTPSSAACDSALHLQLQVNPTYYFRETLTICEGDSVEWQGQYRHGQEAVRTESTDYFGDRMYVTTDYTASYQTHSGCDSIYYLHLIVNPRKHTHIDYAMCDYEGYDFNGKPYHRPAAGIYLDTVHLQTAYSCDSVVTLRLVVHPSYTYTLQDTICASEAPYQITYGTETYSFWQTTDTILLTPSSAACDSALHLQLQVNPTYYFRDTLTICEGDSVEWQGHYRLGKDTARTESTDYFGDRMYVTTDYTVSYQTHSGCDSIYYLHLIVNPRKHTHVDYAMCDYENYDFNGKPYHRPAAGIYLDTVHLQTAHSCDSVVTLHLVVHPSYTYTLQDTICASEAPYQITYGTKTYSFSQTIDTILLTPSSAACDSALHLQLQVNPTYYFRDTLTICEGDSVEWQGQYRYGQDTVRTESTDYFGDRMYVTTDYTASYQTKAGCDSIYYLHLIVNPRKHTHVDYAMCDYENYDFNGKPYHRPAAGIYLDTVHLQTAHSCDSVVTLRLIVHPSYTYTLQDTICASEAPYQITYGTETYSFSQTTDTILLTPSSAACDSALHLQLQVNPTYYFRETLTICEGDSVEWQGHYRLGKEAVRTESTDYFGDRMYVTTDYTASYQTHSGCDSIYYLHLIVNPRKHTHIDYAMCDYENYDFNGKPYHRPSAGIYLDTVHLQTAHSCDSVITLRLVVHPSYNFVQTTTVCQDTINPDWLWIDADGHSHGTISIADSGSYYIVDKYQTIYGCDSVYGIHLRVKPIYRFDSVYTICQNERISWQNKWYCGSHTQSQLTIRPASEPEQHIDSLTYSFFPGDSVLSAGWHYDTAHYYTADGCDSTYYLSLYVKPTYDTILNVDICDNSEVYLFRTADAHGHHYIDSIAISPITRYLPSGAKDTAFITRTRHLTTVEGCDSVVYLHLTVHPTYEFRTTAEICFGTYYEWRGRFYNATGIYFDNQPTQGWGCDSLYILELYVKPAVIVPLYRSICNNETFVHTDTLWYTNGNHSEVNTLVWKPGMTIPQTYTDVIFKGADGCDSIIYRYFLTIHDTYYSEESTTLCSNETYLSPESDHYWSGLQTEYGMGQAMPSIDTTFVDSLTSVYGCDSVFVLHARIHPAYRNIEYDTICGNTEWQWRNHHYLSLPAGEYTYFDSLTTRLGCDSLYEMRLMVYPSYFFETHDTICANNTYLFNDRSLNQTGFYYDSLTTVHFCDSVYHLYLTVLDTTAEFIIDTICTADTIYLHDRPITESGFYKDTTINIYGCDHYTYLSLTKIPPTVPTAWADSLCADDKAYSLSVSYTGESPIAYSLYYDDFGHEQGFVDQENIPIDNLSPASRTLTLTIPMPDDGDDPLHYPRPDHYPVRLVLDNGLCRNLSYCACDTSVVFSYPSWLTRQRFRDVIAILSPEFNGGYSFDRYQWYKDDTLLVGETREYLYIPRGLEVDASYYVRLTRQGEIESYQTCPIVIFPDAQDTIAPTMGYLSVVPTYVVQGHPMVSILSRHEGQYTVHTSAGKVIDSGTFTPDVTEVWLPAVSGVYIFQLVSEQTPEEPKRTIKVIVGDE